MYVFVFFCSYIYIKKKGMFSVFIRIASMKLGRELFASRTNYFEILQL